MSNSKISKASKSTAKLPKPQAKRIAPELKSKILSEILSTDALISDIAKKYGLSSTTLYAWRSDYIRMNNSKSISSEDNFVELLAEDKELEQPVSDSKLSEISLTFSNVSLFLKGDIRKSVLIKIINAID